eukprot:CAMPEP_0202963094 /NCGR_PEP_ID=MMETSP1396-20130829/7089_1 /ASSEMBLY_ACC=CAM_ASM_000872 /TAXON_ID= /ORGANISM="Pseudokeronopsis sp., Strain Brazil" /LENGTH=130 /DNA_ID=CAMNT_0049684037 /DNA_START=53 /DNA_END=446 /DNA_ORIENTATION=-
MSQPLSKSQFANDRGTIYKTDGSGRDTYIFNNNGGFAIEHKPNSYCKPGTYLLPTIIKRRKDQKPVLHSKAVCYRNDGSGRDCYISNNNGGFGNSSGKMMEFRDASGANSGPTPETETTSTEGKDPIAHL